METIATESWNDIVAKIDFSYRPIVNLSSGIVHGFEAKVANAQQIGFKSHLQLLDKAYEDFSISYVELQIRKKAVMDFLKFGLYENVKIFYKFDKRVLSMPDFNSEPIYDLAKSVNILGDMMCLQISERRESLDPIEINALFGLFKREGYKICVENFGASSFNFKTLYYITPDYIKIDQFFIKNVKNDIKKRIFLSKLLDTARMIGSITIAKGVDSKEEFYMCRELGVDLVEGDLIAPPESDPDKLEKKYGIVQELLSDDKRGDSQINLLEKNLIYLEPVYIDEDMTDVLDKFKRNKNTTFLPVVGRDGIPVGVLQDKDLKDYVYSAYGTSLLVNKSTNIGVKKFITNCAIADIGTKLEGLLKSFSLIEESIGVLITKDTKYHGFLSSKALLKALNEQNIAIARDQNPLTKLPGNIPIGSFIQEALADLSNPLYLAYFDFDNFKPFNDKYGFRIGDRAILMFAEIIKSKLHMKEYFLGHIGGDDFFVAYQGSDRFDSFYARIIDVCEEFKAEARALYNEEDRERGYVTLKDREGHIRDFKLLSVSAAIVEIVKGNDIEINRALDHTLSIAKKAAKSALNNICAISPLTE